MDRIKLVNPAGLGICEKGDDGLLRLKTGAKVKADEHGLGDLAGMLGIEQRQRRAAVADQRMIELQRLYEFQIKSINSTDQNEQSAERLMLTS